MFIFTILYLLYSFMVSWLLQSYANMLLQGC